MMLVLSFTRYCHHMLVRVLQERNISWISKKEASTSYSCTLLKRTRQIDILISLQLYVMVKSLNVFISEILKFHFLIICNLRHFSIRYMKLLFKITIFH